MDLKFVPLSEPDIELALKMMSEFYAHEGYVFDKEGTKVNMQVLIANQMLGSYWLIYYNNQIAGYIILTYSFSFEFKGRTCLLDELYLTPDFRHKGIGTKAVDFVITFAIENDLKAMFLEAEYDNNHAITIYEHRGFRKHQRHLMSKML